MFRPWSVLAIVIAVVKLTREVVVQDGKEEHKLICTLAVLYFLSRADLRMEASRPAGPWQAVAIILETWLSSSFFWYRCPETIYCRPPLEDSWVSALYQLAGRGENVT